jgi:N-acetyltransferase
MYVRHTKCVGFLLVEHIHEGKKVLEPAKPASAKDAPPGTAKTSALERLRARRAQQEKEDKDVPAGQPIRVATKSSPAKLGISRIWTAPTHRGQGIANSLLDHAVQHYNERVSEHKIARSIDADRTEKDPLADKPKQQTTDGLDIISKDQVAFSQPTDAGAKLARKWFGKKYGWLVYVD